jgi:hypothetical protein|tara:strand:+ start:4513 stop:4710 length:198 start_codon:yes stop_codon:yes gene_type:complete
MSTKITKCRIRESDNEIVKTVALKLSADKMRVISTAEVLHAVLAQFNRERNKCVEEIINAIGSDV